MCLFFVSLHIGDACSIEAERSDTQFACWFWDMIQGESKK